MSQVTRSTGFKEISMVALAEINTIHGAGGEGKSLNKIVGIYSFYNIHP
jgi:hypothetical protein